MNYEEFAKSFESGDLDEEYMEYLMEYGPKNGLVASNGDTLIEMFESMVLYNEFREYKLNLNRG